jgi:hypothetical protein
MGICLSLFCGGDEEIDEKRKLNETPNNSSYITQTLISPNVIRKPNEFNRIG